MTVAPQTAEANAATFHARDGLRSTLFRVVWLAILVGFAMEILLLLFTAGFEILPGFRSVLVDLIGKVSWSALVCAGLAIGTAASKVRAPFMGLLGLLAAPPRLPRFPHPPAGGGQDPRSGRRGRPRGQLHLDPPGPP